MRARSALECGSKKCPASVWNPVSVVSQNLISAALIAHWKCRAVQADLIEFIGKPALATRPPGTLEPLAQRAGYCLGLRFPCQLRQRGSEFVGFSIANVERHDNAHV